MGEGYVIAMSACVGCGQIFAYNPVHVPSVRVNGIREPICPACVEEANPVRQARGLPLIIPHPEAYEPAPEGEVG